MAFTTAYDPDLGQVRLSMRRNATRISARWDHGRVLLIIPPGVTPARVSQALDAMKPALLAKRPPVMFEPGRPLILDGGVTFSFERTPLLSGSIDIVPSPVGATVRIGRDIDMASPQVPGMISRLLIHAAHILAGPIILPRARDIASRLGLRPRSIAISRGHRVLGHCSARGEIAISSVCLFLSAELRDYIICHELAHLTEMNHSPRFHALCDTYCQGRESELIASLRIYSWPVIR